MLAVSLKRPRFMSGMENIANMKKERAKEVAESVFTRDSELEAAMVEPARLCY